jgi:glyoxylase-like metal-dependent hydrolase (beta-lactamase superfamily II)
LLTHFHGDHAGGATRWDTENGAPGPCVPVFGRARYLGQRLELADASYPNERTAATYNADNFRPLLERNQLDIINGPIQVAKGVRTDITPGHTTNLQAVWVEDGGEKLLFLTDAANWAVHLERLAWVPAFDIFPLASMETKRRLRHEASMSEALLVFQHDAQVVTGRLVTGERGLVVRPEISEPPHFDMSL